MYISQSARDILRQSKLYQEFKQEGRQEGRQEGWQEAATSIARNMLQSGYGEEATVKATGLSLTQLRQISLPPAPSSR